MKSKYLVLVLMGLLSANNVFANASHLNLPPAKCEVDYASFSAWLEDVRKEASSIGISEQTWQAAKPMMKIDPEIIRRDNRQGGFYKSFIDYSIPRAHPRIARGRQVLEKYKSIFAKVEAQFGVSSEVIVAFWGMESDFVGELTTNLFPVITSMTTLAYDCRRPALFRFNLLSALKLIEDGDIQVSQLKGQWAGEMSGLQFTPGNYYEFGVDLDGDGKREIKTSIADMIGTAANTLKSYGWKRNEPYILEVKVPDQLPWEKADLTLEKKFPVSHWAQMGVKLPDGSALPYQNLQASLMLPMGRLGPTFLAFENFGTLLLWNASLNNALTASYLASRIADVNSKPMSTGKATVEVMTKEQMIELQTLMQKRGYDMGEIDGYLGTKTRAATKDLQLKWGLPADAYPTSDILRRLKQNQ